MFNLPLFNQHLSDSFSSKSVKNQSTPNQQRVNRPFTLDMTTGISLVFASLMLMGCSNNNTTESQPIDGDTVQTDAATADNELNTDKTPKTIAITQIVEHPSLDDIRRGIVDELAENGYVQGENLTVNFQSAQGNTATAGQIAKQFVGDQPDAIVAISTPSAQTIVASTKNIPVIYTAVSDPVAAKLTDANNTPIQENVTGLSSELPLEPQLDLLQKIKPNAHAIGYVYSPGEANSVVLLKRLEQLAPARELEIVAIPANRPSDIGMATRSLDGRADIIYTSMDNNVASAFEAMTGAANELHIPIVASDEFSVQRGASAALGVNDYDFGRTTGEMVYRVLNGEAITDIPPQVMNELTLFVSPKHAETQGVSIDDSLMTDAINVDDKSATTTE